MNTVATMTQNPLVTLASYGQSVWFDYIRRSMIAGGELRRLVDEDGLRGVTSNPAIFEKAIAGSADYTDALAALGRQPGRDAMSLYEALAIQDIQDAADVLRPVYDRTRRRDGYVSLEVSPYLARDTGGTLDEARRLWQAVGRENVMIKVPATPEGIPAIRQLIGEGINVNVTLLFAQETYARVAEAYISGLEMLAAGGPSTAQYSGSGVERGPSISTPPQSPLSSGRTVDQVASVASFFISRIDTAVDAVLATKLEHASADESAIIRALMGKVAIANAKLTYQRYERIFSDERWQKLAAMGAHTQRLLWASTGTKNPMYSDVLYVEELIAPDTVNTMPPATFEAFRDHGRPRVSLEEDLDGARRTMEQLQQAGVSLEAVTDRLLDDGVTLFSEAFDKLLAAVDGART